MIISVQSLAGARLRISPDPAIVHVGDRVVWRMHLLHRLTGFRFRLKWTIYFHKDHPFSGDYREELTESGETNSDIIIDAGKAETPGDYKYGVRIANAETHETISDDDPILIVRP